MMQRIFVVLMIVLILGISRSTTQAQELLRRPPAVPLITHDPYFSIWSFSDHPANDWPRHWTGTVQALCGMVRIDGTVYRILGASPGKLPLMKLIKTTVTPTQTMYEFEDHNIHLTFTFTSPLLPYDMAILSRPVSYLTWRVNTTDATEHTVQLYFDASAELAVNSSDQEVIWSRAKADNATILCMGTREQPVLEKSGDDLRIDWGYFYLVTPEDQQTQTVITGHARARKSFAEQGIIPSTDDVRMPRPADDDWPVMSVLADLGNVGQQPVQRFLATVYNDRFSIEYFYRKLRPYWQSNGDDISALLTKAISDYPRLMVECNKFDAEIMADLRTVGGNKYAEVASLAFRQAIAAHKLAVDIDGTPLLFPKENFSNGCISTVDVIYPSSPFFMLFSNDLLKALVTPVFQYSLMKQWKFPFAPHDLGTYPKANGQVYGGGERTEENQMPVEESGNMLILAYAISRIDGNTTYADTYWSSLKKWAEYLKEKGLDPENQLCTDDFAGHLAHNVNLSLKAILALGSYSKLCAMAGKKSEAVEYWNIAKQFAQQWETMAKDGDHFRLAFDQPETWSQKYNLVWDKLLDLNLFSPEIAQKEIRFYKMKVNQFGLPLDNRKDYTKADWLVWTATLAESKSDFEEMISHLTDFLNNTPNRVPFTDWYDTKTAKQIGFQARSVIGGVFIKMLSDEHLWNKWQAKSILNKIK